MFADELKIPVLVPEELTPRAERKNSLSKWQGPETNGTAAGAAGALASRPQSSQGSFLIGKAMHGSDIIAKVPDQDSENRETIK